MSPSFRRNGKPPWMTSRNILDNYSVKSYVNSIRIHKLGKNMKYRNKKILDKAILPTVIYNR